MRQTHVAFRVVEPTRTAETSTPMADATIISSSQTDTSKYPAEVIAISITAAVALAIIVLVGLYRARAHRAHDIRGSSAVQQSSFQQRFSAIAQQSNASAIQSRSGSGGCSWLPKALKDHPLSFTIPPPRRICVHVPNTSSIATSQSNSLRLTAMSSLPHITRDFKHRFQQDPIPITPQSASLAPTLTLRQQNPLQASGVIVTNTIGGGSRGLLAGRRTPVIRSH